MGLFKTQMRFKHIIYTFLTFCSFNTSTQPLKEKFVNDELKIVKGLSDNLLLDKVEKQTFKYFWEGAEPVSGAGRERYHVDGIYPINDMNTIAAGATGFGMMSVLAGMERAYISKDEGLERLSKILNYLEKADRYYGVWSHWMSSSGKTIPFGKKDNGGDLVETSFVAQGLICVYEYYKNGNSKEKAVAEKANALWKGINFDWYRKGGQNILYWHWSPQYHWQMNFPVNGYNECLITYIMAASSPTHGIPPEVYHQGWARNGRIKTNVNLYGYRIPFDYLGQKNSVGPLFWAHYSYLALNPKGLKDKYGDYWENNVNHSMITYRYCIENPKKFKGYGENCWGLTASYSIKGYVAHSINDDFGVISPTAAIASLPYTPKESLKAVRHFYENLGDKIWGKYGFYDAFSEQENWYPKKYLGIDQGPIVVMIENYRSGLLWKLFMRNADVQNGLKKLGFTSPEIK